MAREYSRIDGILEKVDLLLASCFSAKQATSNPPKPSTDSSSLSSAEKKLSASLMRVNHSGEVCAQALYLGQALTCRDSELVSHLKEAREAEQNHLDWCAGRLSELNAKPSLLNPLWHIGSLVLGIGSGLMGDKVSLGFLAETERQVEQHLTEHLTALPENDAKSRAILEQMRADEAQHCLDAQELGAKKFPAPITLMMRALSKIMTKTSRYI